MAYSQDYQVGLREYLGKDIRSEALRHLAFAMILATVIVGVLLELGIETILPFYYIGAAGEFAIIIVLFVSGLFRHEFSETTATILLYSFVVCSSITLSLLVWVGLAINPLAIVGAVGTTTIVVLVAYLMADKTYQKIAQIQRLALILVIIFFVVAIIGFFMASGNPMFYLIISAFSAVIFTIYLFIDFARLENRAFNSPALMALWLFYDIIYLLKQLIWIFLALMGDDR